MNVHSTINYLSYLKWQQIFRCKYLTDGDFRAVINKNKKLQYSQSGNRCFVVGNGPSLKEMNLARLRNEFVFTVNTLFRNEAVFNMLSSNCHIIVDPSYQQYNEFDAQNLVDSIRKGNKDILLITEFSNNNVFKGFMRENLFQVFSHCPWTSNPNIDLASNLLVSQNVVQTAIYAAIYMGFTDIVLIGCEMTSFYENFAANAGCCESFHAYDMTDEDIKKYNKVKDLHDNTYMLQDYAITFDIFKRIRGYADKYGIRIVNATIGGILDMFPRVDYNSL